LNYIAVDIEYSLKVNKRLKGNIDYIIRSSKDFIVIEAKNALLYGAITMGEIWRFGILDRQTD